jgi:diaminohydroxyphosphoribosylaminopyrimidine deaminase/5-amino-6-(5-phosphoribosylamino)uracil reductase
MVSPNPMVGAVIVKNGRIIGEGYHRSYGEPHAEVNAVNAVVLPADCEGAILYVSLEPCSHFGKTPPCSDLLIEKKFSHVVIANRDPFPEVNGKGIEKLKAAGIKVTTDLLADEGAHLNRYFLTSVTKKRPYILLKWAESKDGFIDVLRKEDEKGPNWISSPRSRKIVHQLRSKYDAILVGANTARIDNPSLTVRDTEGNNPIRIVIDRDASLPTNLRIFDDVAPTLIFTETDSRTEGSNEWISISFDQLIPDLLQVLHVRKIQRLMVEGGRATLEQFISLNMWDEALKIQGDIYLKNGLPSPKLERPISDEFMLNNDTFSTYFNT